MLQAIDAQGNTSHICPHCQIKNEHHISHEQMEWMQDGDLVGLPPCTSDGCTTRTFVKTRFPPVEIPPRERWQDLLRNPQDLLIVIAHDETQLGEDGNPIQVRIVDHVMPHPAIAMHQELARQLLAIGKMPPMTLPAPEPEQKIAHVKAVQTKTQ